MNAQQSLDCLLEKGMISQDRYSEMREIISVLPENKKDLYQILSLEADNQPPPVFTVVITMPDGTQQGDDIIAQGGCAVAFSPEVELEFPGFVGDQVIYKIYKNGVYTGVYFFGDPGMEASYPRPSGFDLDDVITVQDYCDNVSNGIIVDEAPYDPIEINAPDGPYPGYTLNISGGSGTYKLVVNDVETGSFFMSSTTTIPEDLVAGDNIQIIDDVGNISGSIVIEDIPYVYDEDALNYISRVEAKDGQGLEEAVKIAMDEFVLSCKAAAAPLGGTNWDAIANGFLLLKAGPRTLAGMLEPLSDTYGACTAVNFVSGDYNRKTGLIGSTGKYIDYPDITGGPTIENHTMAVWVESLGTPSTNRGIITSGPTAGTTSILKSAIAGTVLFRSANSTSVNVTDISESTVGFYGLTRTNPSNVTIRVAGSDYILTRTTSAFNPEQCVVFRRTDGIQPFDGRLKADCFCPAADMTALEASLLAYFNAINAAIP